jgi:hypothetical protein
MRVRDDAATLRFGGGRKPPQRWPGKCCLPDYIVCVDTVFNMVTCRMMIRLVIYDLQNNKHCVGGVPTIPLRCLSQKILIMSKVIFRSIE